MKATASPGIGIRCCDEVTRLSFENNMARRTFMVQIGVNRKAFYYWKAGHGPNAVAIEALVKAGADPLYIMTGNRMGDIPATAAPDREETWRGSGLNAVWLGVKRTPDKCVFECSRCRRRISVHPVNEEWLLKQYPYCHCGAKMEKESDNHDAD